MDVGALPSYERPVRLVACAHLARPQLGTVGHRHLVRVGSLGHLGVIPFLGRRVNSRLHCSDRHRRDRGVGLLLALLKAGVLLVWPSAAA